MLCFGTRKRITFNLKFLIAIHKYIILIIRQKSITHNMTKLCQTEYPLRPTD